MGRRRSSRITIWTKSCKWYNGFRRKRNSKHWCTISWKIQIDGIEYEKIWSEDDFKDLTPEERREFRLKDIETTNDGSYYFKGVLAGNYVVRFKYGNKEANIKYNGQDYKNTAYQVNMLNEDGTSTLDNEWQDLRTSTLNDVRISDARDYELQRMKVIAYSKILITKLVVY